MEKQTEILMILNSKKLCKKGNEAATLASLQNTEGFNNLKNYTLNLIQLTISKLVLG